MPLFLKNNPVGIDLVIQDMQKKLFDKLSKVWPTGIKYNAYGRCYRNILDNGYVAEFYEGSNEYKEVYWDDTLSALSFFGISQVTEIEEDPVAKVHLVFFVNIADLKTIQGERADEEVRLDVYRIMERNIHGAIMEAQSTGLENVLKEYPGSYRDDRLRVVDMHPVHCFRFDFKVRYNPLRC